MRGVENKARTSKFRLSYASLLVAIVVYVGAWGFAAYSAHARAASLLPRPVMIKPLLAALAHHQRSAREFPATLADMRSGKTLRGAVVSNDGRSFTASHYYFLYTRTDRNVCTLWAVPTGEKKDVASSFFLVVRPTGVQKFKGAAISAEEMNRLKGAPSYAELNYLGLVEQPRQAVKAK